MSKMRLRVVNWFFLKKYLRYLPKPATEVLAERYVSRANSKAGGRRLMVVAAKYDYGKPSNGFSYEYFNYILVLRRIEAVDLIEFDFYSFASTYGQKAANEALKCVAVSHQVETILVFLYLDIFDRSLIKALNKEMRIETVLWLFDDDKRYHLTQELVRCFLRSITSIPSRHLERTELGLTSQLVQFTANHFLFRDYGIERDIDVLFVGQMFEDRQEAILKLRAAGINVVVRGKGWGEGHCSQEQMILLLNRSKIALNFSKSSGASTMRNIKGRVFEIPATGALL